MSPGPLQEPIPGVAEPIVNLPPVFAPVPVAAGPAPLVSVPAPTVAARIPAADTSVSLTTPLLTELILETWPNLRLALSGLSGGASRASWLSSHTFQRRRPRKTPELHRRSPGSLLRMRNWRPGASIIATLRLVPRPSVLIVLLPPTVIIISSFGVRRCGLVVYVYGNLVPFFSS